MEADSLSVRQAGTSDGCQPTLGDLIRTDGPPVLRLPAGFSPEERIVLTANGNLQRLISSYYNATVSVAVRRNARVPGSEGRYEREVALSVLGATFATATSTVVLSADRLVDAVEHHGVALGQLFRHFELLPTFHLLGARREADGAFERTYTLQGAGVTCTIVEQFAPGLFSMSPRPPGDDGARAAAAADGGRGGAWPRDTPHFGDIMAAAQTGIDIPVHAFSPLQRLLLTANGNVQRIVGSYYDAPVTVTVLRSERTQLGDYERHVAMAAFGRHFMTARSSVHLLGAEWVAAAEAGVPLGSLFSKMGVLPAFALHSVGQAAGSFWRVYSLRCAGMACEIHETFADDVFELRAGGGAPDAADGDAAVTAAQHFC